MIWSEAALTQDAETHRTTIMPSMQGALFDVAESTPALTGQDAIIYPDFESPSVDCDCTFISWMDILEYRIDDKQKVKDFEPFSDHHLYGKEIEIIAEHKAAPQQMLWRRFKLDELKSTNAFRQAFPISQEEAFYASAGLFFHKQLIDLTRPQIIVPGIQHTFADQGPYVSMQRDDGGPWRIYKESIPDHRYLIAADTAEGKATDKEGRDTDYCAGMIFDLSSPLEEVGIFHERIPPEIFAEQVGTAARHYNDALVVPERTGGSGLAFIVRLQQFYSNIYRTQKFQHGTYIITQDLGFQTTSVTKPTALSALLSRIRDPDKRLTIHSDLVRLEMAKFAQKGAQYGSLPGFHDDTLSCLWLAAVAISQSPGLVMSRDMNRHSEDNMRTFEPKINRAASWQLKR